MAVDANGIAWLAADEGDSHAVRTFDNRESSPGAPFSVELAEIVAAQALGAHKAALLSGGALWSFEDGVLEAHALPVDSPSSLCGDPKSNGAVLAAGRFMERRGNEWWAWRPPVSTEASLVRLMDVAGECYDKSDSAWMLGADQRLWRLSSADTQLLFSGARSVDVTAEHAGVLTADSFYFGRDDWQRWTFPAGPPDHVVAGGKVMWLQRGNELLRFDGSEFVTLARSTATHIDALRAHAGGIWVEGEGRVCHYQTQQTLRVAGIRPGERAQRDDWAVDVELSASPGDLQAWLNGDPLDSQVPAGGGMQRIDVPNALAGWNEVRLVHGTAERVLVFKRQPSVRRSWATDIEPISISACLNCHAPGQEAEQLPLTTYEQWVAGVQGIRERVVQTETMPPMPAPGWEAQVRIIAEWLEGGTSP